MMHDTYKGILLLPSQLLPSSNNYAIIIIIVTNIILIVMITQQKSPINNHLCLYMSVKKSVSVRRRFVIHAAITSLVGRLT